MLCKLKKEFNLLAGVLLRRESSRSGSCGVPEGVELEEEAARRNARFLRSVALVQSVSHIGDIPVVRQTQPQFIASTLNQLCYNYFNIVNINRLNKLMILSTKLKLSAIISITANTIFKRLYQ